MPIPSDVSLLLVEDDPDDAFLMRRALKSAHIVNPLHLAEDGQKAIDYLTRVVGGGESPRNTLPAIVFLDLKLPYKTGFEVLEFMRALPAFESTAVVVLTSSSQPRDLHLAYQLGARSYLVKPPTAQMLTELVTSLDSFWEKRKIPGS